MELAHAEDFYIRKLLETAKIKEIMKTDMVKVHESDHLSHVQEKFVKEKILHILVVDKADLLTGFITPELLYKIISPTRFAAGKIEGVIRQGKYTIMDRDSYYIKEDLDKFSIVDIMEKSPFTLKAEDTIAEGILSMSRKDISCIPILGEHTELAGIFTHQEIVSFFKRILTE